MLQGAPIRTQTAVPRGLEFQINEFDKNAARSTQLGLKQQYPGALNFR
jgi:hypothetical protein